MAAPLLDAATLSRLDRLSLTARRAFAGQMKGDKRSVRRGASVEFADYREYLWGDDLRYVDWNTAARLDRLFVKLFIEEEDLFLALLVDVSASMGFGAPTKLAHACRIAAALGYVGLTRSDRVAVTAFADVTRDAMRVQRGRSGVPSLFGALDALRADGKTAFADALHRFAGRTRSRGLAVVLSDFLDPDWARGITSLLARGFQVAMVQVLSHEEVEPTVVGDLRMVDSETGDSREVSIAPGLLVRYRDALAAFTAEMEAFARRHGVDYLRTLTGEPPADVVLSRLRRAGIVT